MFYKAIKKAIEWKDYLAEPNKHWRTGYSAKELAYCWQNQKADFPDIVNQAFIKNGIQAKFLLGIPEYKVPMPGTGKDSQNDIFVLARINSNLCPIVVEGKCNEPFGKYCDDKSLDEPNRNKRYLSMLNELSLNTEKILPEKLRYQLLHRTLSAIRIAKDFDASTCMMIIHRIGASKEGSFNDYRFYLSLFNIAAEKETVQAVCINDIKVLFLWIEDQNSYSEGKE
ncbi:MAG: hypothetical protein SCM11_04400 [Bacillota bacterium]|nr:hypothetical protein [Bacillota bacterium]